MPFIHSTIMKSTIYIVFIFIITAFITGCPGGRLYDSGTISETPVNLADINSEYDDYNSDLHMIAGEMPLIFSTNRQSRGSDFDFIYYYLVMRRDLETGRYYIGEIDFKNSDAYSSSLHLLNALAHANTTGYDQLGPYTFFEGRDRFPYSRKCIFLYSDNTSGNQDIKFMENLGGNNYSDPLPVAFLKSAHDDAYPSVNADSSAIYFCSDREGTFDIYRADIDNKISFYNNIKGTSAKSIAKETELNSAADDKCPFVNGNLMVFTSNRAGGFGGYDLYYCRFSNGKWSEPMNFGSKINTSADEYRPVTLQLWQFTNDFMIFSSNRSGGKGGFDLYYVGIPKMIE